MVGKLSGSLMTYLEDVINWIIPDVLREDIGVYKRVRMFVISHLFGPFLGHPITIYLFLNATVFQTYEQDKADVLAKAAENWPAMRHISVAEVNGDVNG